MKIKRVVSLFVAIVLVLSIVTANASALSYSGSSSYKSGKYYTRLTNVTLTGDQRTDIVNIAKSQVGYVESSSSSKLSGETGGSGNYTEYGRWYGMQDMWCAMFVSWCANVAGVSTSIVPSHSYTPTGLTWFQDRGRAYSRSSVANGKYTPQPGDIIYFKTNRNNNPTNHVGIVTKYSGGTVYTVEGNTSGGSVVDSDGGAVCDKSYSISNTKIVYICSPAYKDTSNKVTYPYQENSDLVLYDGEANTGLSTAYDTSIALDTATKTKGSSSLSMACSAPAADTTNKIGGMVMQELSSAANLSGYNYLTLDLYVPRTMAGSHGFQVNFATEKWDGYNAMCGLDNMEAGWHTIVFDRAALKPAVTGANWASVKYLRFTWFNHAGDTTATTFKIDNVRATNTNPLAGSTPSVTYPYEFAQGLMLYDGESVVGAKADFGAVASQSTEKKQGTYSLKMEGATPQTYLDQQIGAMINFPISGANLTAYNTIHFDLYVGQQMTGKHNLQVNFCTEGQDGFNVNNALDDKAAGWYSFDLKLSDLQGVVSSANWSSINNLRFTWFNEAKVTTPCYFLIDNIYAYKATTVTYPYQVDDNTMMLYDGEDLAHVSTAFETTATQVTTSTQGKNGLKLSYADPLNASGVGGMAYIALNKPADINDYVKLVFDLYLPADVTVTNGFQINLCTQGSDGYNITRGIEGLKAGWNTVTVDMAKEANAVVDTADKSNILTLRLTWFNYAGTVIDYMIVDNIYMEKETIDPNAPIDLGNQVNANIVAADGNLSVSGKNVIVDTASDAKEQEWTFVRQADGSYLVINQANGNLLTVNDQEVTVPAPTPEKYPYGDVDENGQVNATDALIVLKIIVGKYTPTQRQMVIAEVSNNGEVGAEDALEILKHTVGKIDKFPIELAQPDQPDQPSTDPVDAVGNVVVEANKSSATQKWFIYDTDLDGKYVLRSAYNAAVALEVASDGNVHTNTENGSDAQEFLIQVLVADGEKTTPVNLGSNFFAKITAAQGMNLSLSGENVIMYGDSMAPAQIWKFVRQSDGSYEIVNQKTGQLLEVPGSADTAGTEVKIGNDSNASGQRWFIYQSGSEYVFYPACSTTCVLEADEGSTSEITLTTINTAKETDAQKFTVNMVDGYADLGAIVDLGTNFFAKINAADGINLSLSDTNVITYTDSTASAQVWEFVRQTNGSYEIINQKTGTALLSTADTTGAAGTNVLLADDTDATNQRWFVYQVGNEYVLRTASSYNSVLAVEDGSTQSMANVELETYNGTGGQLFTLVKQDGYSSTTTVTAEQMTVLRNIMYAVETGGQVYGQADYSDFTEAYTNTPEEHAITIGAGQWYATEAKRLLNMIRTTDPTTFAALDTAGIAADLDSADWSTYKLDKTSAKAKCIQTIISSDVGIQCQNKLMDEQLVTFLGHATDLGVTDLRAKMLCVTLEHLGGQNALKRVLDKTATPYTMDNIMAALETDTGNQVGTFKSRNNFVYRELNARI